MFEVLRSRLPASWTDSEVGGVQTSCAVLSDGLVACVTRMRSGGFLVAASLPDSSVAVTGGDLEQQVRRMVRHVLVDAMRFSASSDWGRVNKTISGCPAWACEGLVDAFQALLDEEVSDFWGDMTADERDDMTARAARFGAYLPDGIIHSTGTRTQQPRSS